MTPYWKFLVFTVPTYPFFLSLGVLVAAGIAVYRLRKDVKAGRVADVCVAGLVCGVAGARLIYVLFNLDYYGVSPHTEEITRISSGGLNWHGAVYGGLLGVVVMARLRRVMLSPLLDALAVGLPLIAFAGWSACGALACAYGAEVDNLANYPGLFVAELSDIFGLTLPRYHTQGLGALLALGVLVMTVVMMWRGWLAGRRFWVSLGLLGLGMFGIGFLRGDVVPQLYGLRLDQWLDLSLVVLSTGQLIALTANKRHNNPYYLTYP